MELKCKKCDEKLSDLKIEGEFGLGEIEAFFIEEKVKIEKISFFIEIGDECGETHINFSCKSCGEKGDFSFWAGGQAKFEYCIE